MVTNTPQTNSFLSWIGKHAPVSSSTIAHWLRTCLLEASTDRNVFKPHSIRGASCSSAVWPGISMSDILKAADWSWEGIIQEFYHYDKDTRSAFEASVLSSAATSNLHVDKEMEPSIYEWLRAQDACMLLAITWGRWRWNISMSTSPPCIYVLFTRLFSFCRKGNIVSYIICS